MKALYDETYACDEVSSRNIWYSEILLHLDDEFGSVANLAPHVQQLILNTIRQDLHGQEDVTETNWYFYDSIKTQDANKNNIRTSLMIKFQDNSFTTHLNMSDHSFAVNFHSIQKQLKALEILLNL